MTALIDAHDAALFDLDGVVYLGPDAIPAAAPTIAALSDRGVRCGYVTNNASRPPAVVAHHLNELGIACAAEDIVTSAQAAARLLTDRLRPGSRVMVVGTDALVSEVAAKGFVVVDKAADEPEAVVQGLHPGVTWSVLVDAAIAVQRGALWVATNTDSTKPGDRGLEPGNGAAVAVVRTSVQGDPLVAGKPYAPLMEETMTRIGCRQPIFVGDRLDTDIAGAHTIGIASLLVLTGAHGPADLLAAPPEQRPTHLGWDVSALLEPAREAVTDGAAWRCGEQRVSGSGAARQLHTSISDRARWLDALWVLSNAHWDEPFDDTAALLDQLGAPPSTTPPTTTQPTEEP
ncbi:HAD-IIA family hydrolase [Propionibacteriaceae bacterium Y1685]|uniref:HAD-IIA family hydrolase n=1 Tax=Microlunatus sp. Y1700 TaxID=3418487 RepID=UPI003B80E5C0